jgi:threonine dehydratase
MITKHDVEAAADLVDDRVRTTPILRLERGFLGIEGEIFLKLESLQHTGSFKPRGIFNRILSAEVPAAGIIAASGGNAGLAVAYAARELGVDAEIFVPETSPRVKIERLARYGADVQVTGLFYADAFEASRRRAAETGALVVHAYDQPEVAAGQGTLAMELEQQIDGLDTVLVAVGGGGLVAGIATWLENVARVVAVEPENCPTLTMALKNGRPVEVEVGGLAADSLGARRISGLTYQIATRTGMESLLVPDDAICKARQALWDELRVVAEPGGATALAALTSEAYRPALDERVAVIICGANSGPCDLVRS